MALLSPVTFTAHIIGGAARGRQIGSPTLNADLSDVPQALGEGIYACFISMDEQTERFPAVMHYGPRPVFADSLTCEIHVLDRQILSPPTLLTVDVVAYIRSVSNFPSTEALQAQIQSDIKAARGILNLP